MVVALASLAAFVLLFPVARLLAQATPPFGEPLPGLPAGLIAAFEQGKEAFLRVETAASGLGPVHNGRSCVECHSVPAPGGSAPTLDSLVTRFAQQLPGQPFNPLLNLGGPNLQKHSIATELPGCALPAEAVPAEANLTGLRQPPPLFGLGLIQAIPDTAILANADPNDDNADGIAGRPNIDNGVIGRFGWKAASPTILHFVGLALVNELGITNYVFPNEMSPQGQPIPPGCKLTADPEDADATRLAGMTNFLTLLSPPPRGPITDTVLRGEALFAQVGCASCHVPVLRTGPSPVAALSQREARLYSDLLTHYMGGALDDRIQEGAAGGGRWRTAPLWGLRTRRFYLHDGRTSDLVTAIRLHGGEAAQVRARFLGLAAPQQADVVAFLRSL
jgi:CxxC motif-containing protein (DUF1111 family)